MKNEHVSHMSYESLLHTVTHCTTRDGRLVLAPELRHTCEQKQHRMDVNYT